MELLIVALGLGCGLTAIVMAIGLICIGVYLDIKEGNKGD